MRILLASAIAAALLTSPALAANSGNNMKSCAASWNAMAPSDKAKTTYRAYSTACLKNGGHAPAPGGTAPMAAAPAAAAPKAAAPMAAAPMAAAAGTTQQQKVKTCAASWKAMSASAKAKTTYKAYSSTCLKK